LVTRSARGAARASLVDAASLEATAEHPAAKRADAATAERRRRPEEKLMPPLYAPGVVTTSDEWRSTGRL
jgi:hypothetical protein